MNILILLIAALVFISVPASAVSVTDDVRAQLREHLKNPEFSLDRKPEYVITDPAFIEPVLDQALKYIDLSQPLSPAKLIQAKKSAETYYRLYQKKPAGLKALEAVIATRFAQPVVTRRSAIGNPAGETVELDLGWMIGPLTDNTRYSIMHDYFVSSSQPDEKNALKQQYFEGRAPSTRLLARLLGDAARAYPRAERVSLVITFPYSILGRNLHITYSRSGFPPSFNGWVQLQSKTASTRPHYQVWVKDEDFSPYREGRYSFYVDCMPIPGVGRVPRSSQPMDTQRRQCLNYAERPNG